eukprot:293080_1
MRFVLHFNEEINCELFRTTKSIEFYNELQCSLCANNCILYMCECFYCTTVKSKRSTQNFQLRTILERLSVARMLIDHQQRINKKQNMDYWPWVPSTVVKHKITQKQLQQLYCIVLNSMKRDIPQAIVDECFRFTPYSLTYVPKTLFHELNQSDQHMMMQGSQMDCLRGSKFITAHSIFTEQRTHMQNIEAILDLFTSFTNQYNIGYTVTSAYCREIIPLHGYTVTVPHVIIRQCIAFLPWSFHASVFSLYHRLNFDERRAIDDALTIDTKHCNTMEIYIINEAYDVEQNKEIIINRCKDKITKHKATHKVTHKATDKMKYIWGQIESSRRTTRLHTYDEYVVYVPNHPKWVIYKRYRDFVKLYYEMMQEIDSNALLIKYRNDILPLPSRRHMRSLTDPEKRKHLEQYLQSIMNHGVLNQCVCFLNFLQVPDQFRVFIAGKTLF